MSPERLAAPLPVALAIAGVLLWPLGATAAQDTWSVSAGAEHTDNINLTSTNEQGALIESAGAQFAIDDVRPNFSAQAVGDVTYQHYSIHEITDGFLGGAYGSLTVPIVDRHLTWLVDDHFGQMAINVQAVDTPVNRQNFNIFATGPSVTLPLAAATDLTAQALWTKMDYQRTLDGMEQYSGNLALVEHVSAETAVSVNASSSHSVMDHPALWPNFDIRAAYLRYDAMLSRTSVTADAGYSDAKTVGPAVGGALLRLRVSRKVAARSTFAISVGKEFSDAATQVQQDQTFFRQLNGTSPVAAAGDPVKTKYANLQWGTAFTRTNFNLSAGYHKDEHLIQYTLNRRYVMGTADLSRQITPTFSASVGASMTQSNFDTTPAALVTRAVNVGVTWRVSHSVSLDLRGSRASGTSTDLGPDFRENQVYLGIRYSGSAGRKAQ